MADRIASWGYVVLVPNVFYRDGPADALTPTSPLDTESAREFFRSQAMPRVHALTPDQSGPDTQVWVSTLLGLDGVRGPLGVVGYCMGARLAIRAACDHPDDVRACAGFHGGRLATEDADSPHLGLPHAGAEFAFGHADQDSSMPAGDIARLGESLAAAGLTAVNDVYAGAPHGYAMADTMSYNEAATERHFRALKDLLGRTLST